MTKDSLEQIDELVTSYNPLEKQFLSTHTNEQQNKAKRKLQFFIRCVISRPWKCAQCKMDYNWGSFLLGSADIQMSICRQIMSLSSQTYQVKIYGNNQTNLSGTCLCDPLHLQTQISCYSYRRSVFCRWSKDKQFYSVSCEYIFWFYYCIRN